MSDTVFFHSDSEIEAMVDRLEICDFEKGEFTHTMHFGGRGVVFVATFARRGSQPYALRPGPPHKEIRRQRLS